MYRPNCSFPENIFESDLELLRFHLKFYEFMQWQNYQLEKLLIFQVKVASISNGVPQVYLYVHAFVSASTEPMMLKINDQFNIDSEFESKNGTTNGTSTALSNNGEFDKFDSKLR